MTPRIKLSNVIFLRSIMLCFLYSLMTAFLLVGLDGLLIALPA